ncbi:MAG: hypothetical protein L0Y79_05010 [Chlorobi bacterium]|nr:hypothetical protein [Chlorobiota bacterium]MCI0717152.1 hypothetical protein [Chlorobiota bacterium]
MKTLKVLTAFAVLIAVLNCSKITEKVGEKVEEKVNEEVKKNTEEMNKQLKQADSLMDVANEEIDKEKKITEALEEEKILKDPNGQWAVDAEASSSYGDAAGDQSWSPKQLTGAPNCERYGDNRNGWASKDADKGIEWVKLTFKNPVFATELRIRQNYNPGAIIKVELIDTDGKSHTIWSGADKTKYEQDAIQYFVSKFDKSTYKTKEVKITLATNTVDGWNEIDAVQLIGTDK